MVILGWILDKPLPLLFDPFESIVRFPLIIWSLTVLSARVHRFCIFPVCTAT